MVDSFKTLHERQSHTGNHIQTTVVTHFQTKLYHFGGKLEVHSEKVSLLIDY